MFLNLFSKKLNFSPSTLPRIYEDIKKRDRETTHLLHIFQMKLEIEFSSKDIFIKNNISEYANSVVFSKEE